MQYKKGTIVDETKVVAKKVLSRMAPFVGPTEVTLSVGNVTRC